MSDAGFVPLLDVKVGQSDSFQPWAEPVLCEKAPPVDEFERGLAEGQAIAAVAFADERRRLQALIAAANALQPVEPESLRTLIYTTVVRLVHEVVGATPVDVEMLQRQVGEAMDFAGAEGNDAVLKLSPDDAALLADAALPLPMVADAHLTHGTLRLETHAGAVQHGRAVQLEALRMQLGLAEDDQ